MYIRCIVFRRLGIYDYRILWALKLPSNRWIVENADLIIAYISHEYGGGEKELWLSNGLGVQLWNNIRALDLLCSMPEVDADNIGMTGASGGGSQTLFLSLLDSRVKAAAPINMISLHMQGGCQCENAPGLRRDTDNGEMCALIAPRALFLAGSTGDWTKDSYMVKAAVSDSPAGNFEYYAESLKVGLILDCSWDCLPWQPRRGPSQPLSSLNARSRID